MLLTSSFSLKTTSMFFLCYVFTECFFLSYRESAMLHAATWLIAFSTVCSRASVESDIPDLPLSPSQSLGLVTETGDGKSIQTSPALLAAHKEPPPNRLVHEPANGRANQLSPVVGNDMQVSLSDPGMLAHMDLIEPSSELDDVVQSPLVLTRGSDDLGQVVDADHITQKRISGMRVPPAVTSGETSAEESVSSTESAPSTTEAVTTDPQLAGLDSRDLPAHTDAAPPAAGAGQLPVPLGGTSETGRSRHRPEPGLAPSERKPSSRRTGVPPLEMLESRSKPRKGAPAPPQQPESAATSEHKAGQSSRRTGVPDLQICRDKEETRKSRSAHFSGEQFLFCRQIG